MVLFPGRHHLHKRERIHKKKEKFPSPNKKIRLLDTIVYIISVLGPAMSFPQVIKIFILKDAGGISLITHASWLIFSCVWVVYGVAHKEKPIVIANVLWIFFEALIIVGIFLYSTVLF